MENQNKEKKLPTCIEGIQKSGRFKRLRKKKTFWAGILSVGLITVIVAGLLFRNQASENKAAGMSVQSATASTGSISTTVVGTGTLAEGSATDVAVPVGIKVKEVLVESGETVKEGQELAALDEASIASQLLEVKESIESVEEEINNLSDEAQTAGTTEYLESKVLNGQLAELKEAQDTLNTLLESKVITASCAGTISSIHVTADTVVTQSSGNTAGSASGTSSSSASASGSSSSAGTSSGSKNMNMSGTASGSQVNMVYLTADITQSEPEAADQAGTDAPAAVSAADEDESGAADSNEDINSQEAIRIESCAVKVSAPVTGEKPQTEIPSTDQYTGTISWNCSTETFLEKTVYTATIKLTAKEGYVFSANILPEIQGADVSGEVLADDAGNSILKIKAEFAKTAADKDAAQSGSDQPSDNNGTDQNGGSTSDDAADGGNALSGGSPASGGSTVTGGGVTAGTGQSTAAASNDSGSSGGSSSDGTSSSDYSVYEAAAFSIASPDEAVVSINVDELDILSVEKGQTAVITLDALENQEFEGTITKVSATASSGSSSAKYPVEITMKKTDDMKLGMSVSATIQIDESEDAVLIPINALQEKGNRTFVYTGTDEDGNPTGETGVETGLSDGSQVEIISGLKSGDIVYYLKADGSDSGFDMSQDMMGGFGQDVPGGGMPSGGMPEGGMPEGGPDGFDFSE
ncbi:MULTISPECIES: HlyD family efflux transporter periplasmic adaptor subunit [Clostridia]|uniref:HlyD family efflux transporter periplasmic adaptor subunit n=1 Tax=Clostridia TaxID=186801 RepID=UPI00067EA317|nr:MULTISPECIES: HlyD family efflux transporter periplasmic adaptor subunit [Clostridia]